MVGLATMVIARDINACEQAGFMLRPVEKCALNGDMKLFPMNYSHLKAASFVSGGKFLRLAQPENFTLGRWGGQGHSGKPIP